MFDILAQGVGILAMLAAIFSFQCRRNRWLFFMQMLASILFSVHFGMLGALTGLLQNSIGFFRCFLCYKSDRAWARHPLFLWSLLLAFAVCGVLGYSGPISLLPPIAMIVSTVAMWSRNGHTIRLTQLCAASPLWLIYNISVFSISGIVVECFNLVSVVIALCRFGWRGAKEEQTEQHN